MDDKKRAPAHSGDQGSNEGQTDKSDQHQSSIPESVFKGPYSLGKLKRLIEEFNIRFAVVVEHGKCLVFRNVWDDLMRRFVLERIGFPDLQRMYSNQGITITIGKRDVTKTAADWWLDDFRRRQYLGGVVFDPSMKSRPDQWNLWRGFSVNPQPGDWSLMKAHLLNVICAGDPELFDYLMNWLARMFQNPELQGEVAIVVRGLKGCGKGTVPVRQPLTTRSSTA